MGYGFILFVFLYGYMYGLAGDIEKGATFFVPAILLRELKSYLGKFEGRITQ